jgi:hypothetical protein
MNKRRELTLREERLVRLIRAAVESGRGRVDSDDWMPEDMRYFVKRLLTILHSSPYRKRKRTK